MIVSNHGIGEPIMDRDSALNDVMRSIEGLEFGCQIRPVGGVSHLMVSFTDRDGNYYAPWIWLSISSKWEWFIQIMNKVGFVIPPEKDIAKVAVELLLELTGNCTITEEAINKHGIRMVDIVGSEDCLDIDYPAKDVTNPGLIGRNRKLKEIMNKIKEFGFGCQIRVLSGKMHLMCSNIGDDGKNYAPWFWLSVSSRGEWFFQIMGEVGFVIPEGSDIPRVATALLQEIDGCMVVPDDVVNKYNLRKVNVFEEGEIIDIDYESMID